VLTAENTPLTDFERECRILALSGLKPKEIAARLGRAVHAVNAALERGHRKLRYETKG
jgi:DNA-binding CsgD family transcriptional regulator